MTKPERKYKQAQHYVGMQVIDSKGTVVGNVKDISVDFQNRSLAFRVTTKNRSELDMSWDDVLSVEDVVLLKKNVDLPMSPPQPVPGPSSPQPPLVQAMAICPTCGTSAPNIAKFCPKCGANLK